MDFINLIYFWSEEKGLESLFKGTDVKA